MISKLYRIAALMIAVITFGFLGGCSDDNGTDDLVPTIEIRGISSTETTISFTLNPANATSYAYACPSLEDYNAKNYTLTKVEGGESKTYTIADLAPASAYVIVAVAYNGSKVSEEKASRTTTAITAPTIEILDLKETADGMTCVLKASEGATQIKYTVYNIYDELGEGEEREWVNIDELKADGNPITISNLDVGDYYVEAYSITKSVSGEPVKKKFEVLVKDRPYVRVDLSGLTFEDADVELKKNLLCATYYAGMSLATSYNPASILSTLKGSNASKYHFTDNYTGSLRSLVEANFTGWAPETNVVFWIVPCDEAGVFSEDGGLIIKKEIAIPKQAYEYNGTGTVAVTISDIGLLQFTATVNATDCVRYYTLYGTKAKLSADYLTEKALIENGLLKTTPQTLAELVIKTPENLLPNTDYMFYAVGIDRNGKIGQLTTKEIRTKGLTFDSAAACTQTISMEPRKATIVFDPNSDCKSVRYLYLTPSEFANGETYGGLFSRVESAMALNNANGMRTMTFGSTPASKTLTLTLDSNQLYLLFVMPVDANGGLGQMAKETAFTLPKFDLTGTATAEISGMKVSNASGGSKRVKFTATASEGCTGFYFQLISGEFTYSDNAIANLLASGRESTYVDVRDAPEYDYDRILPSASNMYIYILCKDAEGKWSNPNTTRTLIK